MQRGAGLPEVVDLGLSAKVPGWCTPRGTGQLVPATLLLSQPACKLSSASLVLSPPHKNALHPTHRRSHVPSDTTHHPSNCPSQHTALRSQAQLSYCCLNFRASSISAVPLCLDCRKSHGAILLVRRNHKASEQCHTDWEWAQLTPLGSFMRGMLEHE